MNTRVSVRNDEAGRATNDANGTEDDLAEETGTFVTSQQTDEWRIMRVARIVCNGSNAKNEMHNVNGVNERI